MTQAFVNTEEEVHREARNNSTTSIQKGYVYPIIDDALFTLDLENIHGTFVIIFSNINKLHDYMEFDAVQEFRENTYGHSFYEVDQVIEEPKEFCESIWDLGLRIMLDPTVESELHTSWHEVIRFDPEMN